MNSALALRSYSLSHVCFELFSSEAPKERPKTYFFLSKAIHPQLSWLGLKPILPSLLRHLRVDIKNLANDFRTANVSSQSTSHCTCRLIMFRMISLPGPVTSASLRNAGLEARSWQFFILVFALSTFINQVKLAGTLASESKSDSKVNSSNKDDEKPMVPWILQMLQLHDSMM